jgi:phosphoribosylaminoimidazolecarboxamide formyltransferase/IMP cyclohydrolase
VPARRFTRALISVSDKSGIIELAGDLYRQGVEIVASDGTAATLRGAGISARAVSEITGSPELLGGKVKTLHPTIHAAVLASESELKELAQVGIEPIDLVIVNLYTPEFFDIGGPALIRAAAKNYARVTVVTSPEQYPELRQLLESGSTEADRKRFAEKAITLTAEYDLAILKNLGRELRYGENPHQRGWISGSSGLAGAEVLQGKAISFNNYLDANAGLKIIRSLTQPSIAIIKHGIPSGVASAASIESAWELALKSDPLSAFGGVIVANRAITGELAQVINQSFFEQILAPEFSEQARKTFSEKKNLRLIALQDAEPSSRVEMRAIDGGFLLQEPDRGSELDLSEHWKLVSGAPLTNFDDALFAWKISQSVRSNAIVVAKQQATVGIGSGQVNRVDAARLATTRAGQRAIGSVAASDAFFPFADGLQILIDAGVSAVVQPGGSVRDDEVIALAQSAGITMYFTGIRHFSHN